MSIRNVRERLPAATMLLYLIAATAICAAKISAAKAHANNSRPQAPACRLVSFKAALDAGDNFERELGGGLLFRVRSQDPGWFLDIVPAEANTQDYIYPVNLPLRLNPNQNLGPGYGETLKSSLAHAHEMRFLLNRSDYERVFGLIGNVLWSYQTSDPDKALADYTNAVDDASKGWLKVTVSSYKTDAKGALTRIKLRVEITAPPDFQFAPHLNPFPWPCHP